ncbi:hypothetical protein NliqN6_1313 [Naganishia liquefaciens]|uniref:Iron hydrogenase large subunit C-terminal domain-containing protein n=1 Tax=Naganishia liquefaciens TaxID=104408 RepID=A0A8H3YEN0_9TREE|nr:hypothetical protein NliqN6_1313 [Naganishia liquefaciens]
MAFSGALTLTDLDDFLAPSQACILPVRQTNKAAAQADGTNADTEIHIDENNNYYEVAISAKPSTAAEPPTLTLPGKTTTAKASDGNAGEALESAQVGIQSLEGGVEKAPAAGEALQKAEISLNDCLACSGCVTSTESMLITLQSHLEVQAYITAHRAHLDPSSVQDATPDARKGIISISPQTLASLCASYTTTNPRARALSSRRLLRRIRHFLSRPDNGAWTATWDTTFARHLSLLEHVKEYKERRAIGKGKQAASSADSMDGQKETTTSFRGGGLPMLASACPGWVCYAEKAHGELLGFVSAVRSSQGVMGALVKQWWAAREGKSPNEVYHVTVMPCYDKKLEASRSDFYSSVYETRDVDCVLTTGELDLLLRERGFDPFAAVPGEDDDEREPNQGIFPELLQHPGTSSGSYLHVLLDHLAAEHPSSTSLITRPIRGSEDHVEYLLVDTSSGEILFKGAKCYGFRNLQNLVRKVGKETGIKGAAGGRAGAGGKLAAAVAARRRAGRARAGAGTETAPSSGTSTPGTDISPDDRTLDYVEVMACPGGCVNGGGQMKPSAAPAPSTSAECDEEGYPRIWAQEGVETGTPQIEESMRWSTKAWVAKVENVYWSDLPTPPASPPPEPAAAAKHQAGSLKPFDSLTELRSLAHQPEFSRADDLARSIIVETCKPRDGQYAEVMDEEAEQKRWEFLRTRYRKVESDIGQLTASAVKW